MEEEKEKEKRIDKENAAIRPAPPVNDHNVYFLLTLYSDKCNIYISDSVCGTNELNRLAVMIKYWKLNRECQKDAERNNRDAIKVCSVAIKDLKCIIYL